MITAQNEKQIIVNYSQLYIFSHPFDLRYFTFENLSSFMIQ